jgi:two-component system response regulator PilR (NtrC family)
MKVLIVDDEAELVETYARFLERRGHECLRAYGQGDAFDRIERDGPDLILTDIHMPDGDGLQVVRHARQRLPRSFVAVMTATAIADSAWRDCGAMACLRKPFQLSQLDELVRGACS